MAASGRTRAMSCAWPWWLQLLCGCVLATLMALNTDAMRLDRERLSSDEALVEGLISGASVLLPPESVAARAQRDRDLRAAAAYIDVIGVQNYLSLGNIKDILERFEDIKDRVTSFKAARDPRHRIQIREILRNVKERGEALKAMAWELETEGEVDDGGDEIPTERDNICGRISEYRVDLEFRDRVRLLCEYLDIVRQSTIAGEDEEPMAYSVSGLLNVIATRPDYRQNHIYWEIEQVLGEERRWVAKHLVPRSCGAGNTLPSPQGPKTRCRRWATRAWATQIWADVGVDAAALPLKALKNAQDELARATVEDDLILSSVLTRIQRLEFCKRGLAKFISRSDPAFRERIRDAFHEIKTRTDALHALAARKLSTGEVDNSGELLPSQRDNICTKLEASDLEDVLREDVRRICEAFDRLHCAERIAFEMDKVVFELLGRMRAIKRRPGFSDMPVASELDNLLAEELRWLKQPEGASVV